MISQFYESNFLLIVNCHFYFKYGCYQGSFCRITQNPLNYLLCFQKKVRFNGFLMESMVLQRISWHRNETEKSCRMMTCFYWWSDIHTYCWIFVFGTWVFACQGIKRSVVKKGLMNRQGTIVINSCYNVSKH